MTMMEMGEVPRFNFAVQAAMRSAQTRGNGHGAADWSHAEALVEQLRFRLRDALFAERAVDRVSQAIVDATRERVRDVIRDRFPTELRASLLGWSAEPGLEFSRIEKRMAERLTDAITER